MITFRYIFTFSNASVNFGETESSLVDRDLDHDKSLTSRGHVGYGKTKMASLQNETTRLKY